MAQVQPSRAGTVVGGGGTSSGGAYASAVSASVINASYGAGSDDDDDDDDRTATAASAPLLRTANDDAKLILSRDPDLLTDRGQALRTLLQLYEYDAAMAQLKSV